MPVSDLVTRPSDKGQIGSRSQTEYVQHRRRRVILQLGSILDDERPHARSHQNRNVLLAVDRVADRRRLNWAADVEAPYLVQGLGVIRRERAVVMTEEDQIAGGRKRASHVRIVELTGGLRLAGRRIDGLEAAVEAIRCPGSSPREPLTRLNRAALIHHILLLDQSDVVAALDRRNVKQTELRIVGTRFPVLAAVVRGAQLSAVWLSTGAVAALRIDLDVGIGIVVKRP